METLFIVIITTGIMVNYLILHRRVNDLEERIDVLEHIIYRDGE